MQGHQHKQAKSLTHLDACRVISTKEPSLKPYLLATIQGGNLDTAAQVLHRQAAHVVAAQQLYTLEGQLDGVCLLCLRHH